jgi:hypothetical protein
MTHALLKFSLKADPITAAAAIQPAVGADGSLNRVHYWVPKASQKCSMRWQFKKKKILAFERRSVVG